MCTKFSYIFSKYFWTKAVKNNVQKFKLYWRREKALDNFSQI